MIRIINADVVDGLRSLPEKSVHCVITSPPYWGLRDYGVEGQIGLEKTPEEYLEKMVQVFREVWRVLRDDGTLWLNIGDSYANAQPRGRMEDQGDLSTGDHGELIPKRDWSCWNLKEKNLAGIPWRLAFALQAEGWYLRSDIIWCLSGGTWLYVKSQKGVMPMTVKDLARLDISTVQLWNGNKWTNIKGVYPSEPTDPVEIVLRSGERIGCTKGHVFPLKDGLVKPASDIKPGDCLRSCKLPDEFESLPELPADKIGRFVGLYLAEGSRGKQGSVIQIASHSKETARFEWLQELAASYHGTCRMHNTGGNAATINIYSKILTGVIDTYVGGNNARNKHLKNSCWARSNEFLYSLLMGYLEGDGHYDAKNIRFRLGFTRNYALERDLRVICARLGFSLTLNLANARMGDLTFPSFRGEIRLAISEHHNKDKCEVLEVRNSRGRKFWDIEVEDNPHVFALASGVLTHNSKPNPMPESITDRPTRSHEYVFLLAKSARYFYDADAVREKYSDSYLQDPRHKTGPTDNNNKSGYQEAKAQNPKQVHRLFNKGVGSGRNRRDVWTITTQPTPEAHFATFPEALVEPCIKAGTSERGCCSVCGAPWIRVVEKGTSERPNGDQLEEFNHKRGIAPLPGQARNRWSGGDIPVKPQLSVDWQSACTCNAETVPCTVLDPFGGSGTVAKVARDLNRDAILIEINPAYVEIARRKLRADEQLFENVKVITA